MSIKFGEYKGHKIAEIENNGYSFKLGLGKISAIIGLAEEMVNTEEYKAFMANSAEKRAERTAKQAEREAKKQDELKVYLQALPKEQLQALLA